jgi:acyl-homoserine-lactone acylase
MIKPRNIAHATVLALGTVALPSPAIAEQMSHVHPYQAHLLRDSVGMAHIYATREEDAFYGLGYATAEDRLEQVLTWYVAVRGELAATFGTKTPPPSGSTGSVEQPGNAGPLEDAVANDVNARRFRLLETARANLPRLPKPYRRDLQAYVNGLAAYMLAHPEKTPAWAPHLEPALPLALMHLLVLEQGPVCDAARAEDRRSAPLAQNNVAPSSANGTSYGPSYGPLGGSNAWVLTGAHTADGRVLFSSDSHGPIQAYGTLFYPFRMKAGGLDVTAFSPAGSALFFFGYSPYFAWGITEGPRHPADCYRIAVEPGSPQQFKFDGRLQHMQTSPYTIAVKNGTPLHGSFEYTRHNGVTSPVVAREGDIAYVVSYASADRVGLGAGEYYRLAKARNRRELESALAQRDAYPANLLIGGADGTIMYIRPGRIPIRAPGIDVAHTQDGNHSSSAWRGIHSYDDALKLIDPPQGYLSNSNVSPDMMFPAPQLLAADYPSYYAFESGQTSARQQRFIELLADSAHVGVDGAKAIAMDETIPDARGWGAAIAAAAHDQPDLVSAQVPELQAFLADLAAFDGAFSKQSRGALDYFELRTILRDQHHDVADALGAAVAAGRGLSSEQQALLIATCVETRRHLLELYGRADLAWGDIHRVGRGGVDLPIGGAVSMNDATPRALWFTEDPVTKIQWLTGGQRVPFLVHFTKTGPQAYAQMLWGVSDDPHSPHYSDQARLASDKILRPIPQTVEALQDDMASETLLTIDMVKSKP